MDQDTRTDLPVGQARPPADAAISSISGNSNISILETMDFDHFYFGTAVFTANFARPPLEAETFIKEIFDEHNPLSSRLLFTAKAVRATLYTTTKLFVSVLQICTYLQSECVLW